MLLMRAAFRILKTRLLRVRGPTDIARHIKIIHRLFGPARRLLIICGSATSQPHSLRSIIIGGGPNPMPVRPMSPGSVLILHHCRARRSHGRHWQCQMNLKLVGTLPHVIVRTIVGQNACLRGTRDESHLPGYHLDPDRSAANSFCCSEQTFSSWDTRFVNS